MTNSAFGKQIANRNCLSGVGFKFNLTKFPKVDFFSNSARIPELNLELTQQASYLKNIDENPENDMYINEYSNAQILTLKDQFNALGKQVLSRPVNNQEQILLAKLLREHIEEFESNPIEANKLVSIGITPYTTEIPKVELAAWISVTRAVLNLHETITRN